MTVLDASVVIAVLDGNDTHHQEARNLLAMAIGYGEPLGCSPITLAEVLVRPARARRLAEAEQALHRIGIEAIPLPVDAPTRLAQLRAESGMKLPDCCVMLAAAQADSALITFDDTLAKAAAKLGLRVLSS